MPNRWPLYRIEMHDRGNAVHAPMDVYRINPHNLFLALKHQQEVSIEWWDMTYSRTVGYGFRPSIEW